MQTRVNYSLVGVFVVGLGGLLVLVAVWLGGDLEQSDYLPYRVHVVGESVGGLSERATVTYRGVEVGFVERVALSEDLERVELTLRISPNHPLREGTTATLRTRGLTGTTSVELSGGTGKVLPHDEERPPLLEYQHSRLAQLDQALGEVLDRVDVIAERVVVISTRIEDMLDDENRDSVNRLLASVSESAERVERLLDDENIDNLSATLANLEALTARLERLTGNATGEIESLGRQGRDILRQIQQLLSSLSADASETLDRTERETRQSLSQLDQLVEQLEELAREFEQDPRQLLFGPEQHPPGPGER
ncbi:MlaD family protein [Litchfieldella rifensis]|uniref:MlaD family protein n=1 Tax=Litchfieldella rifensis TaxID=762643 RepID=A0ABV7LJW6_9GAMM